MFIVCLTYRWLMSEDLGYPRSMCKPKLLARSQSIFLACFPNAMLSPSRAGSPHPGPQPLHRQKSRLVSSWVSRRGWHLKQTQKATKIPGGDEQRKRTPTESGMPSPHLKSWYNYICLDSVGPAQRKGRAHSPRLPVCLPCGAQWSAS